jgi:hypothetical protein
MVARLCAAQHSFPASVASTWQIVPKEQELKRNFTSVQRAMEVQFPLKSCLNASHTRLTFAVAPFGSNSTCKRELKKRLR